MVNLMPWRHRTGDGGAGGGGTMMRLRSEMDRLFDRFFDLPIGGMDISPTAWMPSLDITDNANELVVTAEVPGMDANDIDISVSGNVLTISGEKKESSENTESGAFHSERRYGYFRRSVELPYDVKPDQIEADYGNGVLTLHVPKSESQQPKKIQVKPRTSIQGRTHTQGQGRQTSTGERGFGNRPSS